MPASFPASIKNFTVKVDGVDDVLADHINDLQNEVTAIETELLPMIGGWVRESVTWVRTANTTFTRAGATSDLFPVGCKLRWKENGGAYRYAYGISLSGITITIVGDTLTAGAVISSMGISYVAAPAGFPVWFSYTPTYTGFSANPIQACRFAINGRTCRIEIGPGTSGVSNATSYTLTVPVAAAASYAGPYFPLRYQNNGVTGTTTGMGRLAQGGSAVTVFTNWGGATWTASGDKIAIFSLDYEI